MLEVEDVAFINPITFSRALVGSGKNVIRLLPTLEQQFFVIAEYLGNMSDGSAHAVIRSDDGATMAEVLRLSLKTFGGSLLSTKLLAGGDKMADHLPEEGDVLVVGIFCRRCWCDRAARGVTRRCARVCHFFRVFDAVPRICCCVP
ncbi:hypothetical protein TcYC6_0122180 [Trypanosoma cruzi]|nr:hypothetical protein TcYC6_0122180 [Trypanosoma cruzi]